MNLYPDLSMGLRPNEPPSGLNLNSPRRRLPQYVTDDLSRASPSEYVLNNGANANPASPLRPKLSLPSFLPSPSRLIQQLPASPASLLFSPLLKRNDTDKSLNSSSSMANNPDESELIEHIDHYFNRRRQYLQHNIDVSLNISKWVLENMIFYSVETLRCVSLIEGRTTKSSH
jgi:hypothetical protein